MLATLSSAKKRLLSIKAQLKTRKGKVRRMKKIAPPRTKLNVKIPAVLKIKGRIEASNFYVTNPDPGIEDFNRLE